MASKKAGSDPAERSATSGKGAAAARPPEGSAANLANLNEVRFLTVAEVAGMMRVSKMTVYRLVHAGTLPAVQVGRSYRVPEQAVHDYLRHSFIETA